MRINVKFQECENFKTDFVQNDQIIHPYFGEFASDGGTNDYSTLKNKPQINSITLEGNLTAEQLGLGKIYYDTKQGWDTQTYLNAYAPQILDANNSSYLAHLEPRITMPTTTGDNIVVKLDISSSEGEHYVEFAMSTNIVCKLEEVYLSPWS